MSMYRKKPVVVEARLFTGDLIHDIANWCGGDLFPNFSMGMDIPTLEGVMHVSYGDYVIKGVQGEFYPCKPDIFLETYSEVEEGTSNLVVYARRELELIGEDEDVIEWYLTVIQAFSDHGHSGESAFVTTNVIHDLLRYKPLSSLTNDPDEWQFITEDVWGIADGVWQSRRDGEAFSNDGGKTYYLLSEGGNDKNREPLHTSITKEKSE